MMMRPLLVAAIVLSGAASLALARAEDATSREPDPIVLEVEGYGCGAVRGLG